MNSANDIVMKLVGVLLLTAVVLKGWQLLTEPMANNDIWTNRAFLILTVEFEIALGIWLLSGLFKKAAWLATLSCFSLFSFITLYKGLSGAESCGCFGSVHVNPWITLFAIDLPVLTALSVFRQKKAGSKLFCPVPSVVKCTSVLAFLLVLLGVSTIVLSLNEPEKVTSTYEILEPETWIGKRLPLLEHIDIVEKLKRGNWIVLLYHHECPDCAEVIPRYEEMARYHKVNNDSLQIALIEIPPYAPSMARRNSSCAMGRLDDKKEWFVTTPTKLYLENSIVRMAVEGIKHL